MQPLPLATALAAALAASLSLAPQASQPPAPVTSEFRIMTFNIQHGLDNDGSYDLQWAARTIAALHPDLVGVQELTRNHPTYHCQDQPAEIARTLSAATSRRWTYIYKEEWTTKVGDCHGDTPETEGNGFFAPSPLSKAGSVDMWNGRNGLEVVLPVAGGLPIVTTHLQSGLLPQNSADRLRQLGTLLPWTRRLGTPRILICDCNAKPTTPEYAQLHAMYHDAWADAVAAGTAKGRADGITHKHSRIDYVFYDPGTRLRLVSVETVETPALVGREASDHRPVVATFAVR